MPFSGQAESRTLEPLYIQEPAEALALFFVPAQAVRSERVKHIQSFQTSNLVYLNLLTHRTNAEYKPPHLFPCRSGFDRRSGLCSSLAQAEARKRMSRDYGLFHGE